MIRLRPGFLLISALALAACDDDDDDVIVVPPPGDGQPSAFREFSLKIENVAPWTVLKAGSVSQRTDLGNGSAGPSQAFEIRFSAGTGQFLSFATMLGESNDWFFAPGPQGIRLYNDRGEPRSGDVTPEVLLWDAGTEFDQEPAVGDATGTRQPGRDFGEADPQATVRQLPVTIPLDDGGTFVRPQVASMIRVTLTPGLDRSFSLRIENVSRETTLVTSQGSREITISPVAFAVHRTPAPIFQIGERAPANGLESLAESGNADPLGSSLRLAAGVATPLSPGVFIVHMGGTPLFSPGSADFGLGLQQLAEDGMPMTLLDALRASPPAGAEEIGSFDVPTSADAVRPALQGEAFEVRFSGQPGDSVSFATMFGASNDWFFASVPEGIPLFDRDIPRSGDVTSEVRLWDLGTEADEELDVGPNVGTQQVEPNTGRDDRDTLVREVGFDRYNQSIVRNIRVTLTPI